MSQDQLRQSLAGYSPSKNIPNTYGGQTYNAGNDNEALRAHNSSLIADNDRLANAHNGLKNEHENLKHHHGNVKKDLAAALLEIDELRRRLYDQSHSAAALNDANARIRALTDENKRLSDLLASRLHELDALRVNAADVEALRNRIALVVAENERITRLYQDRLSENEALRRRCGELEATISGDRNSIEQLTLRNKVLSEDIERLKGALASVHQENDQLRQRVAELSPLISENEALRNRIVLITQENERITRLYQDRLAEIDALRGKNAQLEAALSSANNSIDQLTLRNKVLGEDIERLKAALNQVHQENDQLRQRVAELTPLISENEALRNRIVLITQENERITRLYQDRLAEIDALRGKNAQLEAALSSANNTIDQLNLRNKVLGEDIERLKAALAQVHQENDKLRQRVAELTPLISENEALRNRIVLITQENERITRLYQDRLQEIDALRRHCAEYDSLKARYNACVDENKRLQQIIVDRVGDIQRLSSKLHEHQSTESDLAEKIYNNLRASTNFAPFSKAD